jgi:MFS family permease
MDHEMIAGDAAEAAVPDGGHALQKRAASSFRLRQRRAVKALLRRSKTGQILLSSPQAFRTLMVGSSISMFGSRISTVAFPMLVLHLNNSPFITGLVAFAIIAPSMLVYMPAGALIDRWNPRRVMLVSEFLRGFVVALVVFSLLVFGDRIRIGFLIPAMVAEEIFEIFSTLADRRYLNGLMERDNMSSRLAYVEVRAHAVVLAGRPIGPFLFALNPVYPFLADALSFLFSIGSLWMIRGTDDPSREPQKVHLRQLIGDVGQGFNWLKKDRRAYLTVILMAITSMVAQALILMFLTEAHSNKLSTLGIGIVLAASGAGGAVGSICSRFLPDEIGGFWLPIQMVVWSLALAMLAMSGGLSVFWSAVAMLVLGATGALGNIAYGTYLVSNVADDMIAKVTGFGQMLAIGACALGPVLGGAAVQRYGVHDAIEILLSLVVLLVFVALLTPEVAEKVAEIRQSISQNLPVSRAAFVLTHNMVTESGMRNEIAGADTPSEASASPRFRPGRNRGGQGEFLRTSFGASRWRKLVDRSRLYRGPR